MKITLIYPPISVQDRYGTDIGDIGGRQAPLGVLYLSAFIKNAGHEVQVIDAEAERLSCNQIIERVKSFNPVAVGISITTVAYQNSSNLAAELKKCFPNLLISGGGAHITANSDLFLNDSSFELGIVGEGENTLLELLECGFDKKVYPTINGLVYRDESGKVVLSPPREHLNPLDKLPFPDRDALSDISIYRPPIGCYQEDFVVSMMTSRGCPYQCIFCDNNTFGRKIRYFSPEYVISEIEMILTKYQAKEITFVDDTFPSNRKRFKKILEMILDKNLRFSWTCMANLKDIDEELAPLMKKAGCWQIAVGIESGDDEILKLIKKNLTTELIRKKVKILHQNGIMVKGFFMMGHPGETPETLKKTTELALSLPLTDVTCTIATPIKGTELYRMAASGKYGKFKAEADFSEFNYWEPVFTPSALSPNELYQAQREFFKKFYLRPSIMFRQIKKIKRPVILKRTLQTVWKILRMKPKQKIAE